MRFAAALLVVLYHFGGPLHLPAPLSNIVACGSVGVNFFFLLSGFILAYTYFDAQGVIHGGRRAFWVARFARVYPVYIIALLIAPFPSFVPNSPMAANSLVTHLADLTLTQAWFPLSATVWNPPGWTLSVEAFFYALFPLLAPPIARLTPRWLMVALVGLWLAALAPRLAYVLLDPNHVGPVWQADTWWSRLITMAPLVRLPEFLGGVALGILFVHTRRSGASRIRPERLAVMAGLGLAVALSLGPQRLGPLVANGLLDPLFALLIYALAWGRGRLARLLSLPWSIILGEASYALYILHWPVWDRVTGGAHVVGATVTPRPAGFVLLYLGGIIGLSVLSLRLVEQPARRAIRRAFASKARYADR